MKEERKMIDKKRDLDNIANFRALQVKLASPEEIKSWSHGEITKSETINYRTLRPEKDGLFCERIFGPTHDWECSCGKYKHRRYEGVICDKCGVEVTRSRVRRERMGHIELAAPCVHVWYFKGSVSPLSILLGVSNKYLKQVIYFSNYLVISVDNKKRSKILSKLGRDKKVELEKLIIKKKKQVKKIKNEAKEKEKNLMEEIKDEETRQLAIAEQRLKVKREIRKLDSSREKQEKTVEKLFDFLEKKVKSLGFADFINEKEYFTLCDYEADSFIEVNMGAEAVLQAVKKMDLKKTLKELRQAVAKSGSKTKRRKFYQRIKLIADVLAAKVDPNWMILRILPVIPPDLRPMVQLGGGKFATSDLNDLYRRVINRNNRLRNLIDIGAPEIILRNEKRMLQEGIDNLIDVSQIKRRRSYSFKTLRSLSEMLKGKKGRFRQNLLGKRVDYSGRSVIIVGPNLNLNQCGLPKEIALEIFRPYILHEIILQEIAPNIRSAKEVLDQRPPEVYNILEKVVKDKVILLNRAPTLHKLSIQAFYPILIDGKAIQLHPCVCSGFNADFDGDQMAIHLPLSEEAQNEAKATMTPKNNLLKPADGSLAMLPSRKEMALGVYYLTCEDDSLKKYQGVFDEDEAILLYQNNLISLRQPIDVLVDDKIRETTTGRIIFNRLLPNVIDYVNENVDSPLLKNIFARLLKEEKREVVVALIDKIKNIGFWAGNLSGLSFSISDNLLYADKGKVIAKAEKRVLKVEESYNQGLITEDEKIRLTQQVWIETTEDLADKTWRLFKKDSPVRMIIDAKVSRASRDQVKQLSAMRGLLVDPLGNIVPMPTKSNFREGLSVFEYVTSSRGSRKGLTDTALKTADAGYLTRRLVDAAHDVIVREENCGTSKGLEMKREGIRAEKFDKRILGRYLADTVKVGRKIIAKRNTLVDQNLVDLFAKKGINSVIVRSPLTCNSLYGVCSKCYGWDFSTLETVKLGTPVGVLAAQSIGEPGTQLTLKTKHRGGIIGVDVTQGLPRIEELFEVRMPKAISPIAEISGKASVKKDEKGCTIEIINKEERRTYRVLDFLSPQIKDGQKVLKGERLASGALEINSVLKIRGKQAAQKYLLSEIQAVYESQGVPINDRHLEIMIRKMSEKVEISSIGDSDFAVDNYVDWEVFRRKNKVLHQDNKKTARGKRVILGITRVALNTESWLSAASFQNTTRILTYSSLAGKIDSLIGLKENVIIGRLVPTSAERAKIDEKNLNVFP